jgi:hypothetical protein
VISWQMAGLARDIDGATSDVGNRAARNLIALHAG